MRCHTIQKELKCSECGYIFPIHRKAHRNHTSGHIKHMYCPKCMQITAHVEMSNEEIFGFQPIYREVQFAYKY